MPDTNADARLLTSLSLPSRYEALVRTIGPEVLRLLVPPATGTMSVLEEAAEAIRSLHEGLFLPIYADSGTGKTTLAENLSLFAPKLFAPTLSYAGDVSATSISHALTLHRRDQLPANDSRVIPINVDHREGAPPTDVELAQIKRFLRQDEGHNVLLIWPDTSRDVAATMSAAYRQVAGVLPLSIPVSVSGPPEDTWSDLAAQTLTLANGVDSLENLVDLGAYDPTAFGSLGDFLKQIAVDFNTRKLELAKATVRDVRLTVVWVSESQGHGVLSTLSSSKRFGMLDPSALVQACSESVIGQWWDSHRGLLVQTIVALDAHVVAVSPPLALAVMSRFGTSEYQQALTDLKFAKRTRTDVATYLGRSDLGRRLAGEVRAVGEGRGNPAEEARLTFETIADSIGFQGARDKQLNRAFASAIEESLKMDKPVATATESALSFLPSLIPDVAIDDHAVAHCLEFTYRKGDFLTSKNRSAIAQYCLTKLKNYARAMGWLGGGE
ncbi:hypothetical protein ROT00_09965 [Agromyces mediolanus]|uniref:hypothetical protein n=1 Tax=Agromyces mediolanus TaxID=41986 RepID=UPI003833A15C